MLFVCFTVASAKSGLIQDYELCHDLLPEMVSENSTI